MLIQEETRLCLVSYYLHIYLTTEISVDPHSFHQFIRFKHACMQMHSATLHMLLSGFILYVNQSSALDTNDEYIIHIH